MVPGFPRGSTSPIGRYVPWKSRFADFIVLTC